MRLRFLTPLLIAIIIGGAYWYTATAYVCPVPLTYRLGQLDDQFNITEAEAIAYVDRSVAVWESASERNLFEYDENADFTINFTFDERQERANDEAVSSAALDARRTENEALINTIEESQRDYETLVDNYNQAVSDYEGRLRQYNQTVQRYNDQGGAPPAAYEELQQEQEALNREAADIENTAGELNELAESLNQLQVESNDRVESYNRDVRRFNNRYGHEHEFTQGDYQGDSINIYKFSSDAEVITVLAHEFGHALGIGHVEDPTALMYYLLTEESETPLLTAADEAELSAVCGTGEEWQHTLRRIIRDALAVFN